MTPTFRIRRDGVSQQARKSRQMGKQILLLHRRLTETKMIPLSMTGEEQGHTSLYFHKVCHRQTIWNLPFIVHMSEDTFPRYVFKNILTYVAHILCFNEHGKKLCFRDTQLDLFSWMYLAHCIHSIVKLPSLVGWVFYSSTIPWNSLLTVHKQPDHHTKRYSAFISFVQWQHCSSTKMAGCNSTHTQTAMVWQREPHAIITIKAKFHLGQWTLL